MSSSPYQLIESYKKPPALDVALALLLCVATSFWGDLFGSGPFSNYYPQSTLTSIGLTLPIMLRRWKPMLMVGLISFFGLLQTIFVPHPTWALAALPFACYSMARWVIGSSARLIVVSGAIGAFIAPIRWVTSRPINPAERIDNIIPLTLLCVAWVTIPYLLGRRDQDTVLTANERASAARQRYEEELERRDERNKATEARVRNEIARELHDIVAHSLSVIVVQAEGGKALAKKRPEKAAEVLSTISDTGREALTEMRRIVGVLRSEKGEADYQPSPGLAEIRTLVERSGQNIELNVEGARPKVSGAVALAAYRVVQEALTNTLKHAGSDAQVKVQIEYLADEITLTIEDDGGTDQARPAEVSGQGYGVRGMKERVSAFGGRLTSGPKGDGWIVQATIPIADKTKH